MNQKKYPFLSQRKPWLDIKPSSVYLSNLLSGLEEQREWSNLCIFCGKFLKEKTKEHVIPQWLNQLTGGNREVIATKDPRSGELRYSSSKRSTLPACLSCNNRYGDLEGKVHKVINKLLSRKSASVSEFIILMDWFDKIRIGHWFIDYYRNNIPFEVGQPLFIDKAIRRCDRMLAIYQVKEKVGISSLGGGSIGFFLAPNVFLFCFKDLLFLNSSWEYMCCRDLGMPYPDNLSFFDSMEEQWLVDKYVIDPFVKIPTVYDRISEPDLCIFQPLLNTSQHKAWLSEKNISPSLKAPHDDNNTIFLINDRSVKVIHSNEPKELTISRPEKLKEWYSKEFLLSFYDLSIFHLNSILEHIDFSGDVICLNNCLHGCPECNKILYDEMKKLDNAIKSFDFGLREFVSLRDFISHNN